MRCCARWSAPSAREAVTMGARRGCSSRWRTSTGCSCAGGEGGPAAGAHRQRQDGGRARAGGALPARDRERRFGAGLSRHGYRHRELAIVDAATAARVKPTDAQRIQRALEVHRTTGRALSTFHAQSSAAELGFEALAIALEPSDRGVLHARIAERFRAMLAAGLV